MARLETGEEIEMSKSGTTEQEPPHSQSLSTFLNRTNEILHFRAIMPFIPVVNLIYVIDAEWEPQVDDILRMCEIVGLVSGLLLAWAVSTVASIGYDDMVAADERFTSTSLKENPYMVFANCVVWWTPQEKNQLPSLRYMISSSTCYVTLVASTLLPMLTYLYLPLSIKERKNMHNRQVSSWWIIGRFWILFITILMVLGVIFSADVLFVQMFMNTPDHWLAGLEDSDDACLASYDIEKNSAFQRFRRTTNNILWYIVAGVSLVSVLHGWVLLRTRVEDNKQKLMHLEQLSRKAISERNLQLLLRSMDHEHDGIVTDRELTTWIHGLPVGLRGKARELLNGLKESPEDTFILRDSGVGHWGAPNTLGGPSKTHGAFIKKKVATKKFGGSSPFSAGYNNATMEDIRGALNSYAASKEDDVLSLDESEFLAQVESLGTGLPLTSTQKKCAQVMLEKYAESRLPLSEGSSL